MNTHIQQACNFVETHGAPWQQAIARFTAQRGSREEALQALSTYQNADGGWWGIGTLKAPLSTISNTLNGLLYLSILNAQDNPLLDNTVTFLKRNQHPEGYWDEPQEILQHAPSIWMAPGKHANQVWYTSAICRYLHQLNQADGIHFDTALSVLHQAWNGDRFPQYIHTHWMALYLFSKLSPHRALHQQIVNKSLTHLTAFAKQENVNEGELGEVAFSSFLIGAPTQALYQHLIQRLTTTQQKTGYWGTPQTDIEDRVTNTLKILGFMYHHQSDQK